MATGSEDFDATQSPGLNLYKHILEKGFQLGSILGVGVVAPARAAYTALWLKQPVAPLSLTRTAGATTLGAFVVVGKSFSSMGGIRGVLARADDQQQQQLHHQQ